MRVLLDNCVDQKFAGLLEGHDVVHARRMGWGALANRTLIAEAEANGFQAIITVDKNLRYQQNIRTRKIGIIILDCYRIAYWNLAPLADQVILALRDLAEGSYITIKSQ